MILSSTRRPGAGAPMMLTIVAIVLAFIALVIALCRDPLQPGFSLRNPFGDPLSSYDFDSAAGTAKSELQIELKRDMKAMMEYRSRFDKKEIEEKVNSFKVESEDDFKREKDPKDKKSKGTGDYKILFVSYKQDGEERKEVMVMEKDVSGLWRRSFLSAFDVSPKNEALGKKMNEWSVKKN
ncbi:MAG: hypothetical protein K8T89_17690 [Planctomycetes bacterium]|nr:hypothetical protein [Planctomycetota bacterium]